jgi:tyrosyl-tRNA synthetase
MQGWDSVMIRCDVELGGTDQLFNLLVGRELQRGEGQAGQVCLTLPLINGLDGRKMSKSYGNAILLTDDARDAFGKTMRLGDEAMETWFKVLTDVGAQERTALLAGNFREAKARLAEEVAALVAGRDAARAARAEFDRVFRDKQLPDQVPELLYGGDWPAAGLPLFVLLRDLGLASSSSEARRLIEGGGVKLEGQVVSDAHRSVPKPSVPLLIQVGKRRFARVVSR